MSDPARNEDARHAVLAYLAGRPALKFSGPAITRGVNREGGDYTEREISAAVAILEGLKLLTSTLDPLGSTRYFQATAQGVLHYERGGDV